MAVCAPESARPVSHVLKVQCEENKLNILREEEGEIVSERERIKVEGNGATREGAEWDGEKESGIVRT